MLIKMDLARMSWTRVVCAMWCLGYAGGVA